MKRYWVTTADGAKKGICFADTEGEAKTKASREWKVHVDLLEATATEDLPQGDFFDLSDR